MSRSLVKGCRGNLAVCSMASCSTNTNRSKRAGTRAVIAMHGVSVGTCHNTSHLMAWHHHGSWLLAHTWLGCNGAYAATVWQCLSGANVSQHCVPQSKLTPMESTSDLQTNQAFAKGEGRARPWACLRRALLAHTVVPAGTCTHLRWMRVGLREGVG